MSHFRIKSIEDTSPISFESSVNDFLESFNEVKNIETKIIEDKGEQLGFNRLYCAVITYEITRGEPGYYTKPLDQKGKAIKR